MSVFSKIKQGRKAAKEHKAKKVEENKENEVPVKVPYKHIPTHAAVDALSGAPSSWKHEDRSKIKHHHERRSQMSRTQSILSTTSYLNAAAGPSTVPALPRNTSYDSYNPTWFDRGGDVYREPARRHPQKRGHSYHDSGMGASIRPSPLASNVHSEDVSPVESSGNSTSSDSDHLEISHAKGKNPQRPVLAVNSASGYNSRNSSCRPQPINFAEKDIFDRLHTSTTRKLGEAPLYDAPPNPIKRPVVNANPVVEQKQKKSRWSLMGKRNSAPIAV